jgi:hypothetical protein
VLSASALVSIALLSFAQVDGTAVTRLPPTAELYSLEDTDFLGPEFLDPSAPSLENMDDDLPGTQTSVAWLAAGGKSGFGTLDIDVNHSWLFGYDEWPPLTITPGLGVHLWSGPIHIDLPPRVYDAYLDLQWRPIERENWGLSVGLTPGLYGDFENFNGKTFQLTGWILGNYQLSENSLLVGGAAYVRQLNQSLLPIGGIIWTPTDDWRLELIVPTPKISRRILQADSSSMWCYVAGQYGGGSWAIADTTDSNVLLAYSDLRLLLGIESFQSNGLQYSLDVGYVFARNLSVDDVSIFDPQDTVLLQASLAY